MPDAARWLTRVAAAAGLLACLTGCRLEPASRQVVRIPPEPAAPPRPVEALPGLAPRPFTAAQIAAAMPVGFGTRTLLERPGQPDQIQIAHVSRADAAQVTLSMRSETPGGQVLGQPRELHETWEGLRDHATFLASETTIEPVVLDTPAGRFECQLYTVTSRAEGRVIESRYHFAASRPGAPVRYERIEDGRRTFVLTLIAQGPGVGQG